RSRDRSEALEMLASFRNLRGRSLIEGDHEIVTGFGDIVETEHLHGRGRTSRFDLFTTIVDQRTYAAPRGTGDERITNRKGASLEQHRSDWTTTRFEFRFEHDAFCASLWILLQLFVFSYHEQFLEQFVDSDVL